MFPDDAKNEFEIAKANLEYHLAAAKPGTAIYEVLRVMGLILAGPEKDDEEYKPAALPAGEEGI